MAVTSKQELIKKHSHNDGFQYGERFVALARQYNSTQQAWNNFMTVMYSDSDGQNWDTSSLDNLHNKEAIKTATAIASYQYPAYLLDTKGLAPRWPGTEPVYLARELNGTYVCYSNWPACRNFFNHKNHTAITSGGKGDCWSFSSDPLRCWQTFEYLDGKLSPY